MIIFHIDVNSAYLSWTAVEQLKNGARTDIRTIPAIIGGDQKSRHGIVLAKSVPAKKYGIRTGEPVANAFRKCPNLHMEAPDHEMYHKHSRELMAFLRSYTPDIEQVSVDECYMNFTGISGRFASPVEAAFEIKDEVKKRFGFTVNIGISDVKVLAKMASAAGFAGADLENLLNEAAIMATRSKRRFIMQADIDEAILKVVMGPEKKSRVVSERARRLTAYHESGHAIASFFLKNSDPVHYITIIPRGAAGGFTWYRKAEDAENFTSRGEMFDSIVSALGGRIAEQLFLDDISTGASNDIQQATNIARDMVMKYGMSEKLGPISFDDSSHSIFIGRDFGTTKSYSEETAATIDEEVKHLFDQAYAKCEALLREHADLLTGLAEYLLIHETIEGDDFRYYCEHGVMPVHPDDTIEPPAKVIRRMDEAPETPQPDAEAPAQPEAPSAPDADAPNSDPGEQP